MVRQLNKATTIGGGTIGSSFTLLFALGGMKVMNYNRGKESEKKVQLIIENSLNQLLNTGLIKKDEIEDIKSMISYTTDIEEATRYADYVQENLPENYEVKQDFVKKFEEIADDDVVLGSSTSGLLITKIAENANHPERIVGAHPYNPPHLVPLIEISRGEHSDEKVAESVKEMFKKLGKKPILINKEVPGFISNRIQAVVMREIVDLVKKGIIDMDDADTAVTFGPGIRWAVMGPGKIFELGGGDYGIEGLLKHIGPSMESWLKDSATWTEFPEGTGELIGNQIRNSISVRPESIGNNKEDLSKYRDQMLIEFLKLHDNYKIK